MTPTELKKVRDWANEKLATGEEPPCAWFQYMKLRETLDAILASQDASKPQTESSPPAEPRQETHLQLVDSTYQQDSAPLRPSDETVQMPM